MQKYWYVNSFYIQARTGCSSWQSHLNWYWKERPGWEQLGFFSYIKLWKAFTNCFCVGGSLLQSCHLKLYQSEDSTVFNYADFQSKITFFLHENVEQSQVRSGTIWKILKSLLGLIEIASKSWLLWSVVYLKYFSFLLCKRKAFPLLINCTNCHWLLIISLSSEGLRLSVSPSLYSCKDLHSLHFYGLI